MRLIKKKMFKLKFKFNERTFKEGDLKQGDWVTELVFIVCM